MNTHSPHTQTTLAAPLRRALLAAALATACITATAQIPELNDSNKIRQLWLGTKAGHEVEGVLDKRDAKAKLKYDTLYIAKPRQRWTIKLRGNLSGNTIHSEGKNDDTDFSTKLNAEMKATLGASVSYRGFTLGVALNPTKLAGKNKDFEFNMNSYGRRFGVDLVYLDANTYNGETQHGDDKLDIGSGDVRLKMLTASAYYAFNHRRFSFPAAFTQSQLQLRSCGTWLLAASLIAGKMSSRRGIVGYDTAADMSLFHLAVGGGYAYNFVTRHNWLIHLSATPQLVVMERNRTTVGDERKGTPFRFPNLTNVGRLAFVNFHGSQFYGLSAVISMWNLGDYDTLRMENVKWRVRLFYGFRI